MRPYVNAVAAMAYIVVIVLVLSNISGNSQRPGPIVMPIAVLSLLVLSVLVMGYLFVYDPARLFLDGQRAEAVAWFWKTVLPFAALAALILGGTLVLMR